MVNVETASTETILYPKDKNKFTELLPILSERYVRMANILAARLRFANC